MEEPIIDSTSIESRAFAACFRFHGKEACQPSAYHTQIDELNGRLCVSLGNVNGLLACFRICNNGRLRRLVRVPAKLDY